MNEFEADVDTMHAITLYYMSMSIYLYYRHRFRVCTYMYISFMLGIYNIRERTTATRTTTTTHRKYKRKSENCYWENQMPVAIYIALRVQMFDSEQFNFAASLRKSATDIKHSKWCTTEHRNKRHWAMGDNTHRRTSTTDATNASNAPSPASMLYVCRRLLP